jgi:hypothetical protein
MQMLLTSSASLSRGIAVLSAIDRSGRFAWLMAAIPPGVSENAIDV